MVRTGFSDRFAVADRPAAASTTNMTTSPTAAWCSRGRSDAEMPADGEANFGYRAADPGLINRTAYTNASVALHHIEKGRARGNKPGLWLRSKLQEELYQLGRLIQRHAGKVLFTGVLLLASLTIGLKSVILEDRIEKLWVEAGGRLDSELSYMEETLGVGAGGVNQMVIQTADAGGGLLLTPDALLRHLEVLRRATRVTVQRDDVTWKMADLCYKPSIPQTEIPFVEQILDRLFPCAIITPLDCFWEGSKLLGPDFPVHIPLGGDEGSMSVSWPSLNPVKLFDQMKTIYKSFPFKTFRDFMKRAGIHSGYQEKPCLDPADPDCPTTAANKESRRVPDVGAELTGGCYGFATRYMHWPEQLMVGGTEKNKSGYIRQAGALQSVVQLMGPRDMLDYWSNTYKVHTLPWNLETAEAILQEFQAKFEAEIAKGVVTEAPRSYSARGFSSGRTEAARSYSSGGSDTARSFSQSSVDTARSSYTPGSADTARGYSPEGVISSGAEGRYAFHSYSSLGLRQLMTTFSQPSTTTIIVGYVLMMVYACLSLHRWGDRVRSQAGLALAGVLLVSITIAAGMGLAALVGIPFNACTTQIVPFLSLGLGVDSLFLLTHTFANQIQTDIPCMDQVGEVMRKSGVSVVTTTFCNLAAFMAASIIPVPAMRSFCYTASLLLSLNLFSMLILFPAMMGLDVRRLFAARYDIFCCWGRDSSATNAAVIHNAKNEKARVRRKGEEEARSEESCSAKDLLRPEQEPEAGNGPFSSCQPRVWTLTRFAVDLYASWILKTPVRVLTLALAVGLYAASAWGINRLEDGLALTDLVPQNTSVWRFLDAQDRYFGFYNMYAVTRGNIEYPQQQALLHEYHAAFVRVPSIIKDDDGGLPDFWLGLFRNWLLRLQEAYDADVVAGHINDEGWTEAASDEAVLAYKLLVQTGHVDFPVDKSQLRSARLVDQAGIINPAAFYNYLSAWYSNDGMAVSFSQADFVPPPKAWFHERADYNLRIPKSKPLRYAQIPFLLRNLGDTAAIVTAIGEVREICDRFESLGLSNFPSGIPFTFWEQYLNLRSYLLIALGAALGAVCLVVGLLFMSVWSALLVVFVIGSLTAQLFGVLGLLGLKLSAVPAVILILSVGVGVEFTIHLVTCFVGSLGDRRQRTVLALETMFAPVVHGAASTLLGVLMLAFSQFDFILRYFFFVLVALMLLGLFNGLVLLPVLLVMLGPPASLLPTDPEEPGCLPPPTPPPPPPAKLPRQRSSSKKPAKLNQSPNQTTRLPGAKLPRRHHNSDLSLSTIAEESHNHSSSNSCSSYEEQQPQQLPGSLQSSMTNTSVFLEPHITVETSTLPHSSLSGSTGSSSSGGGGGGHVTKVTATAKFKLELHTPIGGGAVSSSDSRPPSSSGGGGRRSRRSSSGSSSGGSTVLPPETLRVGLPPADPLRSSGEHSSSVSSSLSSDGGFSEK